MPNKYEEITPENAKVGDEILYGSLWLAIKSIYRDVWVDGPGDNNPLHISKSALISCGFSIRRKVAPRVAYILRIHQDSATGFAYNSEQEIQIGLDKFTKFVEVLDD